MKIKFCSLLLTFAMLLYGCGDNNIQTTDSNRTDKQEEGIENMNMDMKYVEAVNDSSTEEALVYVNGLKNGWNLGNTFDATDDTGSQGAGLALETKWCGVYTSKEIVDEIKAQGFNTIRIPVSWHNHLEGNSYTINELWLNRVQEVVDYAYANDMYVIINAHHDVDVSYCYPDQDHFENSKIYISSIWSQLSERFRDYDDHLIFESINEPRLVGNTVEWYVDENNEDCLEAIEIINDLNQVFVDTVRSSGGNNVNRYLLIPGYASSFEGVMSDRFKLPADTASHKLIVTVHTYLPYDLALNLEGKSDFSEEDKRYIDYFMAELNEKFVSKGTPVVIGEFGILNKNNLSDREAYTEYFVKTASKNGMVCMWWDNNSFEYGQTFGLINRRSLSVEYPGILKAIIDNSL